MTLAEDAWEGDRELELCGTQDTGLAQRAVCLMFIVASRGYPAAITNRRSHWGDMHH